MRQKLLLILAVLCGLLAAACAAPGAVADTAQMVLVTGERELDPELYDAAQAIAVREGEIAAALALDAATMADPEAYAAAVIAAASDNVRVLILAPASAGAVAAAQALRTAEDPPLLIFCTPQEERAAVCAVADLVLDLNHAAVGEMVAEQAAEAEAIALVCFGSEQGELEQLLIQAACDQRMTVLVEDPPAVPDVAGFSAEIARRQQELGPDCAFVTTDPQAEVALIQACVSQNAIFPLALAQPLSPYQAYGEAFDVPLPDDLYTGLSDYLGSVKHYLVSERNIGGRFSIWQRPVTTALLDGAVKYADAWLQGWTEQRLDAAVLRQSLLNADGKKIVIDPDYSNRWLLLVTRYRMGNISNVCDC